MRRDILRSDLIDDSSFPTRSPQLNQAEMNLPVAPPAASHMLLPSFLYTSCGGGWFGDCSIPFVVFFCWGGGIMVMNPRRLVHKAITLLLSCVSCTVHPNSCGSIPSWALNEGFPGHKCQSCKCDWCGPSVFLGCLCHRILGLFTDTGQAIIYGDSHTYLRYLMCGFFFFYLMCENERQSSK